MGGAKTVNAKQYFSPRDTSRDIALAMAMQNAQAQQMQNQAEMLKMYAGITPEQQRYDASQQSQRAAQLGLQNILRQRELERITNPQEAAMRLAQSKQLEDLTAQGNVDQYMREYMRTKGLPNQYATGLGDSTIGRAAMYDRALAAKQAYEENLAAERQAYIARTQAPVGGLSPEASIAGKMGAEAQNIAAMEAYKRGILGSAAQLGQTGFQSAMNQFSNFAGLQNAQQQSQQAYQQAMLENQAQNLASQRAMTGAWIQAGGQAASSAIKTAAGAYGGGGGDGGGGGNTITGYGGQQYSPGISASGGQFYAPVGGFNFQ
jgi:hypothetical protein